MSATVPTPTDTRLPRRLVEYALSLIGRYHHGESADANAAARELEDWRRIDAAHEAACVVAEQYWAATDASALQDDVPLPPTQQERDRRARQNRRRVLGMLGTGGLTALLAAGGRWAWVQPLEQLALRTGHGERQTHRLSDGTVLALAAHTSISIALYRDRREVRLDSGEVRFEVQRNPARPFTVATAWGHVEVLGTVFSVSVHEARMRVAVAEGRVAVWAARRGSAPLDAALAPDIVLEGGQGVNADTHGIGARTPVLPDSVGAWRDGWLVFNATPLPEAIARWNDYLPQPVRLGPDTTLRGLRLTGTYPISDGDAFLQSLPRILPIRIVRENGTVTLVGRP